MDQVLVYADSLSWGIVPDTRQRLSFNKRWPGVMEIEMRSNSFDLRVIENCLNGRRTVWSDPFKAGRDGSEGLSQVIELNSPLKLVLWMLGSNDFQCTHDNNAWLSAQGTAKLITLIRQAPIEPGMPVPDILVIAPPLITGPKGEIAHKFGGAENRCASLPAELAKVAAQLEVGFFDSNQVVQASVVDGIHLDQGQHRDLGLALATFLAERYSFRTL